MFSCSDIVRCCRRYTWAQIVEDSRCRFTKQGQMGEVIVSGQEAQEQTEPNGARAFVVA
jgi:hypothetical protein